MRIELLKRVLERNAARAEDVRARLGGARVAAVNLMGSPGSGKTTLLEATFERLGLATPETNHGGAPPPADGRLGGRPLRCAVLEGDLATTRDAERVAACGVPVVQVLTEGGCHLDAATVAAAIDRLDLTDLDLLFIENVGNLVCPANFELGEHARVVVLSVAEGDDKPLKYPYMFQRADAVVVSKLDLLPHCRFSLERLRADLAKVNPSVRVLPLSAYDGRGMDEWMTWVRGLRAAPRGVP